MLCKLRFQWRFCNRFGIKSLDICGEKLSADAVSADEFVQDFAQLTEGYSHDQIFNCDETSLFFKMLPSRTLAGVHNDPTGRKEAKERIPVNACANVTGSIKLPLLFIGKYNNPRCFRGISKDTLSVVYRHQKNAWVNNTIFSDWFSNHFVPEATKRLVEMGVEAKVLLIMDNCSAHPSDEELNTEDRLAKVLFFPPNITSLIQPMDQGVLKSKKRIYRKSVLRDLIATGADDMSSFLNGLHMLKVIERISIAWNQVLPQTIRKSWNKLVPGVVDADVPMATEIADAV